MANNEMNVLKVGNSEFEIADAKARQDCSELKDDLYNTLVTDTASGAIASFSDGADNVPVKSLTVAIEPVQSGSGDPSPTNIRPISGWTQAVVTRCGKNIADFTDGYTISGTGLPSSYAKRSSTLTPIPIADGKAYRFLCTGIHICAIYSVFDAENNLVRRVTGVDSGTVLNTSGGAYLYVCGYDTSDTATVTADENTLMVVFDTETDTAYEPYNGQTYTISLDGTRYGGTLNVETGVLTVDRAFIASYNGETLPSTWISDRDVYAAGTTPTAGAQVCYKLATPQTIQLTANEISTFLGQNHIWNDCGDTEVEYRADTKLYIQKVISG